MKKKTILQKIAVREFVSNIKPFKNKSEHSESNLRPSLKKQKHEEKKEDVKFTKMLEWK